MMGGIHATGIVSAIITGLVAYGVALLVAPISVNLFGKLFTVAAASVAGLLVFGGMVLLLDIREVKSLPHLLARRQ